MSKTKIEFFDCSSELDMKRSEEILQAKEIIKQEVIPFYYLMIEWKE